MWSIPTTEYYPAIKRNEALSHAETRMSSENTPGEASETQSDKRCVQNATILPIRGTYVVKFTGTESRLRSPGAGAAENGELLLNVYRVATGVMKMFWKQRAVTAVSHNILNARNSTLKMVKTANLVPHTHTHSYSNKKDFFKNHCSTLPCFAAKPINIRLQTNACQG